MERRRAFAIVAFSGVLITVAAQYLLSGSAQSAPAGTPVPVAETASPLRMAAGTPFAPNPLPVALTESLAPGPAAPQPETATEACPITLDVFANVDAMLSLSLTAPCYPNEGVVVTHASLSVTYRTTATGSLFLDLPALDAKGDVRIRFPDGQERTAAAPVTDLAALRRFALQWIQGDSFTLQTDAPVTTLGTDATVLPMYAQIVTLPAADTPLAIETAVTATNCGREALGAAYYSEGGTVRIADLSLALPDCDAEGGFVVLNNPVADMKLAAAR